MATYAYKCDACGQLKDVSHGMTETPRIECDVCAQTMRKTISDGVCVVWGGLPPHEQHLVGPAARDLIDNFDQNRDAYLAKKELRNE